VAHRAVEKGREGDEQGPFELSVVTDTGLLFCPWCGTSLKRFYRGSASSSFDLVLRFSHFELRVVLDTERQSIPRAGPKRRDRKFGGTRPLRRATSPVTTSRLHYRAHLGPYNPIMWWYVAGFYSVLFSPALFLIFLWRKLCLFQRSKYGIYVQVDIIGTGL
jgi:hypothetical protein